MKLLVRDRPAGVRARVPARAPLRWATAVLAVLAIAAAAWLLQPEGSAGLRSAQPDRSAHVGRAPDEVRLDFTAPPAPGYLAEVVVLGPQDENLARGPAVTTPGGIAQPVAPLGGRGAYQVVYEVPLVTGEVASGRYWFWYSPTASGSTSRLSSPALLGVLLAAAAALLAGLLAPRRSRAYAVPVPAQRAGSSTGSSTGSARAHPVPAQRSRDRHEGLSPPGHRRPGRSPARPVPEASETEPPRQV